MNKNKGLTLVEILVAVAVFSVITGITTSIFIAAIRAQRRFLALQEITSQTSYLLEYMGRQARMAKKDTTGGCLGVANDDFILTPNGVRFLSFDDKCLHFYEDDGVIKLNKDGTVRDLTSEELNVIQFNINLSGEQGGDGEQTLVTFFIEMEVREPGIGEQASLRIQTTVSQRNLDA